jgi:hypothetical protein
MASVPFAVMSPSSQFFAGLMLTKPLSGTGRGSGLAEVFMSGIRVTIAEMKIKDLCISRRESIVSEIEHGH